MVNLFVERLKIDDLFFIYVGMDYFGLFELKRGRSMVKCYGVIFICFNIWVIYFEVLFFLDIDLCIDVICWFIVWRGKLKFIRLDNGINFVGVEKELKEVFKIWNIN